MGENILVAAKLEWVKKHLLKHPFPVEYIARPAKGSRHIPMTAGQFERLEYKDKNFFKCEPPFTHKAVFTYPESEDILWYTDRDIFDCTLEELKEPYEKWKSRAEKHNQPQ